MSTLLDTNVVSELMHKSPEPAVARWVSGHFLEDLFRSAVSEEVTMFTTGECLGLDR